MNRILVVDDVNLICTMCKNALANAGYEVETQPSGARCMAYLKGEEKVDLLILDVEMPYMDGFKTLESIRKMAQYKELPVMFLTSSCTKETVNRAISLGAKDYLKKPFDTEELVHRVNKILRSSETAAKRKETPAPEAPAEEKREETAPEKEPEASEITENTEASENTENTENTEATENSENNKE